MVWVWLNPLHFYFFPPIRVRVSIRTGSNPLLLLDFFTILYHILDLHTGNPALIPLKGIEYLWNVDQGINILLRWRNWFLYFALAQLHRSHVDAGVVGARRDGVKRRACLERRNFTGITQEFHGNQFNFTGKTQERKKKSRIPNRPLLYANLVWFSRFHLAKRHVLNCRAAIPFKIFHRSLKTTPDWKCDCFIPFISLIETVISSQNLYRQHLIEKCDWLLHSVHDSTKM